MNREHTMSGLRFISWTAIVAMVFAGVMAAPRHTGAQTPGMFMVQFSADETMTTAGRSGNPTTMTGKVYIGKARMRTDMNMAGRGNMAMILNLETKNTIILMLDQKMAMDMSAMGGRAGQMMGPKPPIDTSKPIDLEHPCAMSPDMTCTLAGSETVNGRECQKWIMTRKASDGTITTSTAWLDMKLHYPIKVTGDNFSLELKNVVEGPQPDALFVVPPDFKVMDPSAMMGRGGRN